MIPVPKAQASGDGGGSCMDEIHLCFKGNFNLLIFFVIHILNSFLRAWRASSQLQIFKVHNWASFDLHLHKPRKASAAEDTITLSHQFSVPVPLPTGAQTSRLPSKQHLHLLIWVKPSHGAELHSSCHVFTNSLALFLLDRHITTCPSAC